MKPIDLSSDDGFVVVKSEDAEVTIDLYYAYNRLYDMKKALHGKPMHEQLQAIVDFMVELGLPRVSHRKADQFYIAIVKACEDMDGTAQKKNTSAESPSEMPSSPGSTVPESSTSPAPSV